MWTENWDHLRRRDVDTVAPTSLGEFHDLCRALGETARRCDHARLPGQLGAGKQPDIFKRLLVGGERVAT